MRAIYVLAAFFIRRNCKIVIPLSTRQTKEAFTWQKWFFIVKLKFWYIFFSLDHICEPPCPLWPGGDLASRGPVPDSWPRGSGGGRCWVPRRDRGQGPLRSVRGAQPGVRGGGHRHSQAHCQLSHTQGGHKILFETFLIMCHLILLQDSSMDYYLEASNKFSEEPTAYKFYLKFNPKTTTTTTPASTTSTTSKTSTSGELKQFKGGERVNVSLSKDWQMSHKWPIIDSSFH